MFAYATATEDNSLREAQRVWGGVYGEWPLAYVGLMCTGMHRLTGRSDLLELAAAMAQTLRRVPFPEDQAVPALDLGLAIGLAVDLFDLTGDPAYLGDARQYAAIAMRRYWHDGLFRGAAGHGAYDSQMGVAYLLQALLRLGTLGRSGACRVPADYTAR